MFALLRYQKNITLGYFKWFGLLFLVLISVSICM